MKDINVSTTLSYNDIKRIHYSEVAATAKLGVQRALAARAKAFECIRHQSSGEFEFCLGVAAMFYSVSNRHQGRDRIKYLTETTSWLESAIKIAPSAQVAIAVRESLEYVARRYENLHENGRGGDSAQAETVC